MSQYQAWEIEKQSKWLSKVCGTCINKEVLGSIEGKGIAQSSEIPAIVMYFHWPKVVLSELFLGVCMKQRFNSPWLQRVPTIYRNW